MRWTKHAEERFEERFPEMWSANMTRYQNLDAAFKGATLERGFMNDSRRIVWMLDKYGDFNYDYYLKGNAVFITRNNSIITVINRKDSGMQKLFGSPVQPRFRKKSRDAEAVQY